MIRLQPILVCVLAFGLHWASAVHAAAANQGSGLERATRTFRLQVYETFHTDRAAYDQRIGQVEQVLRDWRARGAPPSEESRLIAWLAEATRASQPDSVRALPEYQRRVAVHRPLLPPAAPPPLPPVVPDNPVSRMPPVRRRMTEPPAVPRAPSLPHLARTLNRPDRDPLPVVPAPVAAAPNAPAAATPPQPVVPDSPVSRVPPARRPMTEPPAASRAPSLPHLARTLTQTDRDPLPVVPAPVAAAPNAPAAATPPPPVVPENPVDRVPPVRHQMTEPPAAPGAPSLPHLARTLNRPERDPVPVVPAPVATTPDAPESSTSPVDLAVLASRIRAFNLTLAEIESELSEPGPVHVERLAMLIDQVDRLFRGRRLSQLYYDALTPPQKQRVDSFASADLTLNLLDQRLFEAQVMLMDDHPEPNQQPQPSDIEQLRSLSDRVKSWTSFRNPESVTP